mgnify:CR=1 FL=1
MKRTLSREPHGARCGGLASAPGRRAAARSVRLQPADRRFARSELLRHLPQREAEDRRAGARQADPRSALAHDAEIWEKVARKLRAGLMPPAGARRPDRAALDALRGSVEARIDRAAAANPIRDVRRCTA